MVEILAPAGNKQNFITAVNVGADAVYLGLSDFSARKSSDNFTLEELKFAISYAKLYNVKVYVAVNTLIKNAELQAFINAIKNAYSIGVDAFILQDIFLAKLIKKYLPNIVLHLSTQAGVCNVYGAKMAKDYGFSRVILARETKLEDIKEISKIIETEVFIQGALCSSYSGHCYFSSFIGGLSGNRGYCKQPCRKLYTLINEKVNKKGYMLSLSDLSVQEDILKLIDAGVTSFKIEGRMRSSEYIASSVRYYKSLINKENNNIELFNNLKKSFNRGDYTKGLAFGQTDTFISRKIQNHKGLFVGKINFINKECIKFNAKLNLTEGDSFKILRNDEEIGNCTAIKKNNQLLLKYKGKVKIGDEVWQTKDVKLSLYANNLKREYINILVEVFAKKGQKLILKCNDTIVESSVLLQEAKTSAITKEEITNNLNKTDIYPFNVQVKFCEFDEDLFVQKSLLNNLRSELYSRLFYIKELKINDIIVDYKDYSICDLPLKNKKTAISTKFINGFDNLVYIPLNYNNIDFSKIKKLNNCKVWLYLPSYLSGEDLKIIDNIVDKFYGVYVEGYFGVEYAKNKNIPFYAGVMLNVFNSYDVYELINLKAENIALAKELSENEIKDISNNLSLLTFGDICLMSLEYCPFDKKCKNCTYSDNTYIVDEGKRQFKLFRYKISECRFMLLNCAKLIYKSNCDNEIYSVLFDSQDEIDKILKFKDKKELADYVEKYTYGNYLKGIL